MEGLEGGGDFETGVAAQGRIDLLKDEGGIGWKLRGRCGQGAANFRRWEIAAPGAEGKHACARGLGSACQQNGGWTKTADGEVDGGVAGAGEVVGDEQASKEGGRGSWKQHSIKAQGVSGSLPGSEIAGHKVGIPAADALRLRGVGEEDVGGHAGGKMDVQPESASSDFPVDHHGPAEGLPRCLDPGEVADGLRANLDVAQSGVLWAYAGQAGVEPLLDVTKHEVILRAIGIGVPGL